MTPAGYTITETLRDDGQFTLARACPVQGLAQGQATVLLLFPSSPRPAPASLARLEHEHSLRALLDPAWAAQPQTLLRQDGHLLLCLSDPGGRPAGHLAGRPLPELLRAAAAMADALAQLHSAGLVHKDIKPDNLLVDGVAGRAWLTGFGIASRQPRQRQALEPLDVIAGTFAYMAPEQTGRMNRSVDSRSDLYALGVTLYQLFCGQPPFQAADPGEWVHCHVARQPAPPARSAPKLPAMVGAILLRLLEKAPEARYQTAGGLAHDLRRCLAQLQAGPAGQGGGSAHTPHIPHFPLASDDSSGQLMVPEKCYGRDAERQALLAAFQRVAEGGAAEITLVAGYSGIGKSSLVDELRQPIGAAGGLFLSGKFDQYRRDIPYATVAQAFQTLVRQLLGQSDDQLAQSRAALQAALGRNGQVMLDLIPELELVLGPQPQAPALAAAEAQNRFQSTFLNFLGVFARPGQPLVLFLDDLQWLDPASLKLLESLLTRPEARHLLLVGAYRDNEVGPAHPLRLTLDAARKKGARMQEIALAPLALPDLAQLVADSLSCSARQVKPLARLVYGKTAGNPFFTIQFLAALAEEGLLSYNFSERRWRWRLERIHAKGFTDNVVELMILKLKKLPPATNDALKQLACLGNQAELSLLALAHGKPEDATRADLQNAVKAGILLGQDSSVKFLHDRVQEAAYSLIVEAARPIAHLKIGRLLLGRLPPDALDGAADGGADRGPGRGADAALDGALDEAVFGVVSQLNRGVGLVTEAAERARLCRLNFLAGKKAKAAVAYASACNYLRHAADLLPPDVWDSEHEYETALEIHLLLAECEGLSGQIGAGEARFALAMRHARRGIERARIYQLRMRACQLDGRYGEAVALALESLAMLGAPLPEDDAGIEAAVRAEHSQIGPNLRGRRVADLALGPSVATPEAGAMISILTALCACAFDAKPQLFPLAAAKALNLSLLHGNNEDSCSAYSCHAVVLVWQGAVADGFAWSDLALRLNERRGGTRLLGMLLFGHGTFITPWVTPVAEALATMEQAFIACQEVGNLVFAGFCAFHIVWYTFESGAPLAEVAQATEKYLAFTRQSGNGLLHQVLRVFQQFLACLRGETPSPASFDGARFREAESLARLAEAGYGSGVAAFHLQKLVAAVLHQEHGAALAAANAAQPWLPNVMAMLQEATFQFFQGLALAAPRAESGGGRDGGDGGDSADSTDSADSADSIDSAGSTAARLAQTLERQQQWATLCPANHSHRLLLLQAEIAAGEGREPEAMRLYDAAIHAAHGNGLLQHEALALELAGRFYAARGFGMIAPTYLRRARDCYAHWGAVAKVRDMERRHPGLGAAGPTDGATRSEHIDLATVVRASQAVSGEIVLDQLVETLLKIALQHAGAEHGLLLVGGRIEAEARTGPDGIGVTFLRRPPRPDELPATVLQFAQRTRETVILDDARQSRQFGGDPYFRHGSGSGGARSVLCLPLAKQAQLVGVLYLENTLAASAFTPDRAAVLELIASQAAISLENAGLYQGLEHQVAQRTQALSQMNTELNQTLAALRKTQKQLVESEKMAALGGLVAGVAHEINTPVGIGVTAASSLHERAVELGGLFRGGKMKRTDLASFLADSESTSKMILRNLEWASELIHNFKQVAVEQSAEAKRRFNLRAHLEDIMDSHARALREAGVLCELECEAGLEVDSYPAAFAQIIGNLAANVVAHAYPARQGGTLRVAARREAMAVRLLFGDDGVGVAADALGKIFEPFFTTRRGGGFSGLGLHIVYNVVTQTFKGSIECDSTPGGGCRFSMLLAMD